MNDPQFTGANGQKLRILLLGGSGTVGATLARNLRAQAGLQLVLAGRNRKSLERVASEVGPAVETRPVNLDEPGGLARMLDGLPGLKLIVNTSGRYREHGMQVAGAAVERGIDMIDIADEPVYLEQVLPLQARAQATGATIVIGSGTAPQASGAMLRLAMRRRTPPLKLAVAACFGVNRVGANAVLTAGEAVGGWLSISSAPPVWRPGPWVDFDPPFGRMLVRNYPLPETVFLPKLSGVETWFAGACLGSNFLNGLVAFGVRVGLAPWLPKSFLASPLCRMFAGAETRSAASGVGKLGIALHVTATDRDGAAVEYLYHRDMTDLTAYALYLTVVAWSQKSVGSPGVHLAHEVVDPDLFLTSLETAGGKRWSK